jgi:non-ribosomal peptide synthase protein (TIGR01720 family)
VPIGRPLPNVEIYLLDEERRPVPVGVPGEIYIGGAGLARGYLGRPELTAQRFVAHPFRPGARLYRSGDLGRYLPDGNLEFLGRLDDQVKIRGFRIELGEVEANLAAHPAVGECVVCAREDSPGDKRLVAYVVPAPGGGAGPSELREHLRARLPHYMVPAAFVTLPALPLSANGKVDRKALPAPEGDRPALAQPYLAPRTELEEALAAIWAEVLGLDRVGVEDNFFELGGDSILSLQVVSRANAAGVRVSPRQFYETQTVAQLAAVAGTAPVVVADQGPVMGPVALTPIQRWFFDQDPAEAHHYDMSVLLELHEGLDAQALEAALADVVAHHDALRSRFRRTGAGWCAHIEGEAVPRLDVVDLGAVGQADREAAVEEVIARGQGSLDLGTGPLVRAVAIDLGPTAAPLLLVGVHHLVIDGISWRVLLEDLQTAYSQRRRGERVVLPAKTTSFQTWASRLWDHARSPAVQAEAEWWASVARPTPLPLDGPGGDNTVAAAETVVELLGAEETRALTRDAHAAYHTQINDVLLTALVQAVCSWSGQEALRLDLEGHGREAIAEDVDVTRTVGWFTSLFPLALALPPEAAPGAVLKAVKEQLRAVPNRGIGYGLVRYGEDPEVATRLAAIPAAQVSFNYLGQFDQGGQPSAFELLAGAGRLERGPRSQRPYLFEINCYVSAGRLRVEWTYCRNLHRAATVQALAKAFLTRLRDLVEHCLSPEAGGFTPSDFPLAGLDQAELDTLLLTVRGTGRER